MPEQGPGARHTAEATKECVHGQIVTEDGFVGSAFKVEQIGRFVDPTTAAATTIDEDEEFEIQLGGTCVAAREDNLAAADVGDDVYIDAADNTLGLAADALGGDAPVAATRVTGVVGNNNAILWTAREAGDDGNDISVELDDPGANDAALDVDVDGDTITVSLATGVAGAITSTAAQVIAAVNEDDAASQLVTADDSGASSGAGVVVAAAAADLAGGADGTGDNALAAGWLPVGKISELDTLRTPDAVIINANVGHLVRGVIA